jgi:hypothetical protein
MPVFQQNKSAQLVRKPSSGIKKKKKEKKKRETYSAVWAVASYAVRLDRERRFNPYKSQIILVVLIKLQP